MRGTDLEVGMEQLCHPGERRRLSTRTQSGRSRPSAASPESAARTILRGGNQTLMLYTRIG
ncbi:hypothetical protein GCM10017557_39770 [Streptomyces aurantiacus]|uniref:Uncharacterized protein n=1 Tax=Streptomyces aurantiacus TaxID=47760 RepID=A0A7G1P123_9ACTN|nr:hypothetical protein GCM10017557_39770 [Streptomyces aurantiacus]